MAALSAVENFSKRTTASLFVAFILLVVGWGLWMEKAVTGHSGPFDVPE